jgi:hypothetical protein
MRQQQQQTLYRRIRCIGKGSYGTVYLAEDAEGRRCALKQVHLHGTPQDGEGALREVRLLRRLRHPYIIRYKDAFLEGGKYLCICMEYGTGARHRPEAGWHLWVCRGVGQSRGRILWADPRRALNQAIKQLLSLRLTAPPLLTTSFQGATSVHV